MGKFRVAGVAAVLATLVWAALAVASPTAAFAGTARFVATTGSDAANSCTAANNPCRTVAHAVSVATSGNTISIAGGTYAEQVHIDRSLRVVGAGMDTTVILQPPVMSLNATGQNAVITIDNAAGVTMNSLTVAGTGVGSCGPPAGIDEGVAVQGGATLILSGAAVRNIGDPLTNGCQFGDAISIGKPAGCSTAICLSNGVGHATISSVQVTAYQKDGVAVRHAGSTLTLSGSTIADPPSPIIASNGVEVLDGALATVSGNRVTGNECNNPAPVCGPDFVNNFQASGILVFDAAAGTVIKGNTVTANDLGIYAINESPAAITISGNTVNGNRDENIFIDAGTTRAKVTGNSANGANYGVVLAGPGSSGNTFTGNTAHGNATFDMLDQNAGGNTLTGNSCATASPSKAHWGCA
jgi:parallel beta-helix repeat protein